MSIVLLHSIRNLLVKLNAPLCVLVNKRNGVLRPIYNIQNNVMACLGLCQDNNVLNTLLQRQIFRVAAM